MDNALNPREIQSRIRRGESVADVARDAGVPEDQVEPFAGPVIAEREHQVSVALASPVRRRGETGSSRTLRSVVAEHLQAAGADPGVVSWDSWRDEDRSWTVAARYDADGASHEALFRFEQRSRFSTATNDEARELIGEATPGATPGTSHAQPGTDPDAEPTIDLQDESALVRVTLEAAEMTIPLPHASRPTPPHQVTPATEEPEPPQQSPETNTAHDAGPSASVSTPQTSLENEPDYVDTELEEVDGVYDFVPASHGQLDALYDMLSSFNEDSVNVYEGLNNPPSTTADTPEKAPQPKAEKPASPPEDPTHQPDADQPDAAKSPVQETLMGTDDPPTPPRKKSHRRAQVPSWDEIMFGGPHPK